MSETTDISNDLWQCGVMYGTLVGNSSETTKSYLIAFIDDYSRYITYSRFYLSLNLNTFLDALERAFRKKGLPRIIYVDNNAIFKSRHIELITTSLGITLIHSKPYTYEGQKKVERFFKIVRTSFLSNYTCRTLADFNQSFSEWLNTYHQKKHSVTGQTPFERFIAKAECIRKAPTNLKDHFRIITRRRVSKDCTVTLNGKLYEVPIAVIGQHVYLYYHADKQDQMEIKYKQKSYGFAKPVELLENCRVTIDRNHNTEINIDEYPQQYRGGNLWSKKGGK